ncbi:MAG: Bcr/CflA family efflux MFS transporter [Gammaproteobacteria bacterium]|nr:MAG: Bcr/CflA family efflux MFS transporter [Gammaproteobacteria bacterium]UTW43453.1 multidrug effflux MFS transporter [bacterium SCSIO 12844]
MTDNQKKVTYVSLYILVLICSIGPFGDTLYTPSLPEIAHALNTQYSWVQLTVTSYLFGYAVGQLLYGPVSDRFGRRPVMLFGALCFAIGSLVCLMSSSIWPLIFGRIFQGFGACAGAVLSVVAIRDVYEYKERNKRYAQLNLAFSIAPGLGPIVGSFTAHFFPWWVNFVILFVLSLWMLIAVIFQFPETIPKKNLQAIYPKRLVLNYLALFKQPGYLIFLLILGLTVAMIYTCLVEAPSIVITLLKLQYRWFLIIAVGIVFAFVLGSITTALLNNRLSSYGIIISGLVIMLLGSLLFLLLILMKYINIYSLLIPTIVVFYGVAFVIPVAMNLALLPFGHITGSATAMMGCFQMGFAALATAAVTFIPFHPVLTLPIAFSVLSLVALILFISYLLLIGESGRRHYLHTRNN